MRKKYSKEQLEKAVKVSVTMVQVIRALGAKYSGGLSSHLSKKIREAGISTAHFLGKRFNSPNGPCSHKTAEERLVNRGDGRRVQARILRRALLELGRELSCEECRLSSTWNGKPITLEIDHKNGDCSDNRQENLRFLCPNCHSQTETFYNKKAPGPERECVQCGKKFNQRYGQIFCSRSCSSKAVTRRKTVRPSASHLEKEIENRVSWVALGRKYGVTDNTIRDWAIAYGLHVPKRQRAKTASTP